MHFRKQRYLSGRLKKKILVVTSMMLSLHLVSGCKRSKTEFPDALPLEIQNEPRDYLRSALIDLVSPAQSAGVDLALLMKQGILTSIPSVTHFSTSKNVFSSLNVMVQHGIGSSIMTSGEVLRAETFSLKGNITPGPLNFSGKTLPLHLSLSANASINIYRNFADTAEAKRFAPFSFVDLPLTIENARKFRRGDLIVIPLDAQFMSSVDGSFLRSVHQAGVVVEKLLGNSLLGHAQSGLRGNLIVSGRFEMHIFKTANDVVRVRLFQQSERNVSGGASASASASAKYTLIPFSKIHQVSEIKKIRRVSFYGGTDLKKQDEMHNQLGSSILSGTGSNDLLNSQFDAQMKSKNDGLLDLAKQASIVVDDVQRATTDKLNSISDLINKKIVAKVNQPIAKMKKFTDQELRFDAQVSWNESRKNRIQFLADYQFDLSNELGQQAFLHAVTGATTFFATGADKLDVFQRGKTIHNFAPAERIARENAGENNPPVVRIVGASSRSEMAESVFQIQVGQKANFSLSENWQRENYSLEKKDSSQMPEESFLTRWVFKQGYRFGIVSDRQLRSSGYISDSSSLPGEQPLYWYSRETEGISPGANHLAQFISSAYNTLGPVASGLMLSGKYRGEVEGEFRGRLVVAFSTKSLQQIFDAKVTTDSAVWRAIAGVSKTFDNTFGLPFLMFPPGLPQGVAGSVHQEDCETISRNWGNFYCHFVSNEFLPRLRSVQQSLNPQDKVQFLESFFGKGFGANKIGAEVLARVLLEILIAGKGKLGPEDVAVWFETRQSASAAVEYNPHVKYGNPELIGLLDSVLLPW